MAFSRELVASKSEDVLYETQGVDENQLVCPFWCALEPEPMDRFQKFLA